MDKFEKHIREHNAEFDEYKAEKNKLWASIESALDEPESKPKIIKLWNSPMVKIAATIVIALGVFTLINFSGTYNQEESIANQELNDIDMHYKGLVAHHVSLVNNSVKLSDEEKKEFLSFIDDLDTEYKELKIELQKNVDSKRVLEAIVINYKKRIELIENLLERLNSSEKMNEDYEYIL